MPQQITGLVFNIQRFSIHDGPGIRTTVFLKGCSLRCFWCHNPEGLSRTSQIQFCAHNCMSCNACVIACPRNAHTVVRDNHVFTRSLCKACGACAAACPTGALELIGTIMTPAQVAAQVFVDRAFYQASGGGVTLSGGEPELQPAFSRAILRLCKHKGVHTAAQVSGNCSWEQLKALLPFTDLFMMDIKHVNPARHKAATGIDNAKILANAERLAATGTPTLFRVPIVPRVNDSVTDIDAIARFVHACAATSGKKARVTMELMPFHSLAADKYTWLGLAYRAKKLRAPSRQAMQKLAGIVRQHGIPVVVR